MTIEEYLAVPYILAIEAVEGPDGEWVRRASHPELPGCVTEAFDTVEAIERLDEARRLRILDLLDRGEPVPVPRPPLRASLPAASAERLGFARWLVDRGRITDS